MKTFAVLLLLFAGCQVDQSRLSNTDLNQMLQSILSSKDYLINVDSIYVFKKIKYTGSQFDAEKLTVFKQDNAFQFIDQLSDVQQRPIQTLRISLSDKLVNNENQLAIILTRDFFNDSNSLITQEPDIQVFIYEAKGSKWQFIENQDFN